jgi:hypothetical protein
MNEFKKYKIVNFKNNKFHITSNFLIGEYFDVLIDNNDLSDKEEFDSQIERIIEKKILHLFFEKRVGNTIPYLFIPNKAENLEKDGYDILIDIISINEESGNIELRIYPYLKMNDKYETLIYNINDFLNYGSNIENKIIEVCKTKIIEILTKKPETIKPEPIKAKPIKAELTNSENVEGYKINFL